MAHTRVIGGVKVDKSTFWSLMDRTKRLDKDNPDKQYELLLQELVKFSEADLVIFDEIFSELMARAYDWNLWAAAYIINRGCSDDGFMDFRAWLIGQGQAIFEQALQDPQSLVDVVDYPFLTRPLALFAVPDHAYRLKTGHDLPTKLPKHPAHSDPTGDKWEDAILGRKYPQLYAKFGDCKELFDSLQVT
jgi:hypothetical protein